MRSPFYQANFCAECGDSLAPRLGFRPRYFCDACAARLNQRRLVTPLAGLLFVASLAVFAFSYNGYRKSHAPIQQTSVSARDSVVYSKPEPSAETEARVLCGARTRRGTPCRHRVLPGQRCKQHIGLPSMLQSGFDTAPKTDAPESRKH